MQCHPSGHCISQRNPVEQPTTNFFAKTNEQKRKQKPTKTHVSHVSKPPCHPPSCFKGSPVHLLFSWIFPILQGGVCILPIRPSNTSIFHVPNRPVEPLDQILSSAESMGHGRGVLRPGGRPPKNTPNNPCVANDPVDLVVIVHPFSLLGSCLLKGVI